MVSALQVFKTTLDGGATELFAIGRYLDTVSRRRRSAQADQARRQARNPTVRFRQSHSVLKPADSVRIQLNARNRAFHFEADPRRAHPLRGIGRGVNLPYECGSGTCGTCKARLVEGEIDDLWPEAAGRKYLKQAGEFLMCQCVARNDCAVEVAGFVYNMDPGACIPAFRAGTISDTKMLTHDVLALSVELDRADRFRRRAVLDDAGARRARLTAAIRWSTSSARRRDSISSSRRSPAAARRSGCSRAALTARASSSSGRSAPRRSIPISRKNILCIAGGSGIAGMMSILVARAAGALFRPVRRARVLRRAHATGTGSTSPSCRSSPREFPDRLRVTIALSDEAVPADARQQLSRTRLRARTGARSRGQAYAGQVPERARYLAGPPPAVDASIRMLLLQAKLPADHIRYDKFS